MYSLLTFVSFFISLSVAQATDQANVPTRGISELHDQLPEEMQRHNELLEKLHTLEERVQSLELSSKKDNPPLDGARTQAEAQATKKAEENAPTLVDSPAIAQYNLAFGLLNRGETEKAKEAFLCVTRDYPSDIYAYKAWLHIGDIQLKLKNFGEAVEAFSEALTGKLDPPLMVDARLGLAEAKIIKEDMKGSCEQLAIVQKEQLSPEQKKRLEASLKRVNCQIEQKK